MNAKKKIALIHSIYAPEVRGGAEVVVKSLVDGLRARGENVFVIALGHKNKSEEVDGARVYRIKPFNLFNYLDINRQPLWLRLPWHILDMFNDVQAWRVYSILKKEKPDIVLTHNLKGLGYYLPPLLKILKIKNIHTVHDLQLLHPSGLLKDSNQIGFFSGLYAWCCKKLFGSPAVVIFPSHYIKSVYEHYGFFSRSQKLVWGNPIMSGVTLKKNPPAEQELNFLFLGQVEEYKGIFELISAFKKLPAGARLHIVGDGQAIVNAKDMARGDERIIFYGRLNKNELEEKIWPMVQILVNPSKAFESFGMVIMESYLHGLPVIASNIGALSEIVKEGETGWLIKPGDAEFWREKMAYALANRDLVKNLEKNCLALAAAYNLNNYLEKIIALF